MNRSSLKPHVCMLLAAAIAWPAIDSQAAKPVKPPPQPALTYTLYPMDDSEYEGSWATGITETGLVPTTVFTGPDGFRVPAIGKLFDSDGDGVLDAPQLLPIPEPFVWGQASGANDYGIVVGDTRVWRAGESYADLEPYVHDDAAVWTRGVSGEYEVQSLGVIDSRLRQSWAHKVNASGTVVGNCCFGGGTCWLRAFIIEPVVQSDGSMVWFQDENGDGVNDLMLPIWPGPDEQPDPWTSCHRGPFSFISSINEAGVICGYVGYADNWVPQPFVLVPDFSLPNPWFKPDADGFNALIQVLPGLRRQSTTIATAVAAVGEVAGSSDNHGVIWKPQGNQYVLHDLGAAPCDVLSVRDISPNGRWVTGYGFKTVKTRATTRYEHAGSFVWRDGVVQVLEDCLTNGVGWTWLQTAAVRDDGVLVGSGLFNGRSTSFVAVPNP
jgi:hypothetical protein